MKFEGSITALVTPFRDGDADEEAFAALIERQVAAGTHGVTPCGTTGEASALTVRQQGRLIGLAAEVVRGRIPVIAGAGANTTAEALELLRVAADAGADAALSVAPYYNKPNQDGLYAHFSALADADLLPIVIYNIPGRSVVDVSVETMARLSRHDRIVGVKDATGDLARVALQRAACSPDFIQISGEDMTAVGFNAMGGKGCISVTANVAPTLCAQMQEATLKGDYAAALAFQDRLAPLHQALFSDSNPAPAKYALSKLGLCGEELRLPMTPAREHARRAVDAALDALGSDL